MALQSRLFYFSLYSQYKLGKNKIFDVIIRKNWKTVLQRRVTFKTSLKIGCAPGARRSRNFKNITNVKNKLELIECL